MNSFAAYVMEKVSVEKIWNKYKLYPYNFLNGIFYKPRENTKEH